MNGKGGPDVRIAPHSFNPLPAIIAPSLRLL
jgi:hypothetical protein